MDFFTACEFGEVEIVRNTETTQANLDEGLKIAALAGFREVCDVLISKGAIVSLETLSFAVSKGHINTTKDLATAFIQQRGYNKNAFDGFIKTAKECGHRRTVRALRDTVQACKG